MTHLLEMETFLRVAARASFSAAARELGLSPASITRRVSALENDLGVKLINRTTRSLSLTETGRNYVAFAERILAEIRQEEGKLARLRREPAGILRVIVSKSFGSLHIGQAVADFVSLYPDVQVSVVVSEASLGSLDPVAAGFDLAIRLGDPPNSRLLARRLGSAKWFACASPEYLDRHGAPHTPADLLGRPCIGHTKYFPNGTWTFESHDLGPQSVNVLVTTITNSVLVGRQLSLKGAGICLLPDYCIAEDLCSGALRRILAEYALPEQTIRAVYAADPYQPQHLKRFVAYLASRFSRADWTGTFATQRFAADATRARSRR